MRTCLASAAVLAVAFSTLGLRGHAELRADVQQIDVVVFEAPSSVTIEQIATSPEVDVRWVESGLVVAEVKPVRALEAAMDGFRVMPMAEAARIGDILITVTGDVNVISKEHFQLMKDGAILANSGHFNVELNIAALEDMAEAKRQVRTHVVEYRLKDGRRIFLLAEGRLINLSAAEGHPASVMDMSFANQALCVEHIARRPERLPPAVHRVPTDIDQEVARLKLRSMNIDIDELTAEQHKYLESWEAGTE